MPLPVVACGVSAWGVPGSSHSSRSPSREGQAWDGGPNGPTPGDAPLTPEREERELPPNPAEGTPLVVVGGAATLAGGIWTTVSLAGSDGDDGTFDGLYGAVPLTAIGLVLVGIGLAKWAGPNQWEGGTDTGRADAPLTITPHRVGAAF